MMYSYTTQNHCQCAQTCFTSEISLICYKWMEMATRIMKLELCNDHLDGIARVIVAASFLSPPSTPFFQSRQLHFLLTRIFEKTEKKWIMIDKFSSKLKVTTLVEMAIAWVGVEEPSPCHASYLPCYPFKVGSVGPFPVYY